MIVLHEQGLKLEDMLKDDKCIHVVSFVNGHCLPCRILKNAMEHVEKTTLDKSLFKFVQVDTDQDVNDDLNEKYNIEYTPTVIVFKGTDIIAPKKEGFSVFDDSVKGLKELIALAAHRAFSKDINITS